MFKIGDRVYCRRHRCVMTISVVGNNPNTRGYYYCYHYVGAAKVSGWMHENGLSPIPPK